MELSEADRKQYNAFFEDTGSHDLATTQYLQWKCMTDLYWFGYEFYGWKYSVDPKDHRRKRVDPDFHKWLCDQIQKPGDKLILVPRLHLKSTWVKLAIVQDILKNPNIRIGLFSATSRLVEAELTEIKHLFCKPELRQLFPDIIPDPGSDFRGWEKCTAGQLTMKRDRSDGAVKVPQEAQITVLGSGARMAGLHMDKAYLDDIIDQDSVNTPDKIKKSEEWWGYIQSIMELGSEYVITGTRYGRFDLYNTMIEQKQIENVVVRRAIENGKVLYKTWFTKKHLAKIKRRQGNYLFSCQYLLDPVAEEDKVFPGNQPIYNSLPDGEYSYYIAVDPAATTESYSDQTGIVVAAVDKAKKVWIERAIGLKVDGGKIAENIINLVMMYKPVRVGIELGLQSHLQFILDSKVKDYERKYHVTVPINMVPIPVSRKQSKRDRVYLTLGSFVREGKVRIKQTNYDLIHEMDFFTGKGKEKDNLVDAASMIFYIVEDFTHNYLANLKMETRGTFWDIFQKSTSDEYKWRDVFNKGVPA